MCKMRKKIFFFDYPMKFIMKKKSVCAKNEGGSVLKEIEKY